MKTIINQLLIRFFPKNDAIQLPRYPSMNCQQDTQIHDLLNKGTQPLTSTDRQTNVT